jgi:hypothetical protein
VVFETTLSQKASLRYREKLFLIAEYRHPELERFRDVREPHAGIARQVRDRAGDAACLSDRPP